MCVQSELVEVLMYVIVYCLYLHWRSFPAVLAIVRVIMATLRMVHVWSGQRTRRYWGCSGGGWAHRALTRRCWELTRFQRPMSDGAHLLSLQLSSSLGIVYGSISTVRMRKEVGGMLLLHTTGGKAVILLILRWYYVDNLNTNYVHITMFNEVPRLWPIYRRTLFN